MEQYLNPWALEVMARHPEIAICDQWGFVRDREASLFRDWWQGRDVHFGGSSADALGEFLAEHVLDVMAVR